MGEHDDSISFDTQGMLVGPVEPGSLTGMETTLPSPLLGDDEVAGARRGPRPLDLSFLEPSARAGSLGKLGDYEIVGVLGRGAMGVVLKGHDRALDRYVAVKVQDPSLAVDRRVRAKFLREARAAAAISDPHVVTIHKVNAIRDRPFLVMEYVSGSLRERIKGGAPLGTAEALRIAAQVARGLAAAHKEGVLHRDIKPANILLDDGAARAKISDFGLAVAGPDGEAAASASPGRVAGTPGFMSPEQARGEHLDARSDLFSLGCLIFAMFAGRSPFPGETPDEVLEAVCGHEPGPPPVPPGCPIAARLAALVERLLAKGRELRPASAAEVAASLEALLDDAESTAEPTREPEAAPPPTPPPVGPAPRPWPGFAAASMALAAAGCLVLGSLTYPLGGPGRAWTVGRRGVTDFRDLVSALAKARPGTHLILTDEGTYDGPVVLDDARRFRDLTIEGRPGATLRATRGQSVVAIEGVPGVTLKGLAIEARKNQHAVTITGPADGATLERLRVRAPDDSAWTLVFVHDGATGSKPRPIVIADSTFEVGHGGVTIQGDGRGAVGFVEVRGNRFEGDDEQIHVVQAAHDVTIAGNLFLGGQPVTINFDAGQSRAILVANNSFFRPRTWIHPADSHPDQEDLLICNNAIFEADAIDSASSDLARMSRGKWRFLNNLWEPSPSAAAPTSSPLAAMRPHLEVASRDPNRASFLRPLPGTPLDQGSLGNGHPKHIGAFPPSTGDARATPRRVTAP